MRAWQEGDLSNYDYLIYLNLAAGRSFCDLTQWPVMPWILKDYTSDQLDLNNPDTFRDLSKPIGALNAERLTIYKERYVQMVEEGGPDPPFLYGTHYSTPGYVLYWLVRSAPAHMLRLQNGRFDAPDRLFVSVADSWESVNNNPADLKELIPEFFDYHGSFLSMREGLNLGVRQGGDVVSDVKLPPWCKTPYDFIRKHREALECEHVSQRLHLWIDLIFGFKQQGEAALDANNVFHYLTYEGSVDLEAIVDPVERASLEAQINEFGQAPQQLFVKPHPERLVGQSKLSRPVIFDPNLHSEVFRGFNSQFLLQIMAAVPYDFNKSADIQTVKSIHAPSLCPQIIPSPASWSIDSENVGVDGTSPSDHFALESKSNAGRFQYSETVENQKFLRLSSARTLQDQKFVRMSSSQFDCSTWDNWSPASDCGTELKETGLESSEEFNVEQGVENSLLLSRRLTTENLAASFGNLLTEKAVLDVGSNAETISSRDSWSPHALMFKERLSLSQALKPHRGPLAAVILSQENFFDSLNLYSAGQDGFVKVFSVPENCQVRATRLGALPLSALALVKSSDKYPLVLAGSNDNCLYAYSVEYDRPIGKVTMKFVYVIDRDEFMVLTMFMVMMLMVVTMLILMFVGLCVFGCDNIYGCDDACVCDGAYGCDDTYGCDHAYGYDAYDCDGTYGCDDVYGCDDNAGVYGCDDNADGFIDVIRLMVTMKVYCYG
ncbi:hypothetical protein L7F22_035757 [Adiantum nelumboides]|nr:hypothetical protein [Adiantum nelumboides]